MTRKSSIENRLISVLSSHLNHHRVTVVLGSIGIVIATTVIVPIATLHATDDQPTELVPGDQQKTNKDVSQKNELSTVISWGEPSNGLRAALAVRSTSDKPNANEDLDFYLAVQNISSHHVSLNYPKQVSVPVELKIKSQGSTKLSVKSNASLADFVDLTPHEVKLFRLISPGNNAEDRQPGGSTIVQDLINDPQLTAVAEMTHEQASDGLSTRKLVTGELNGRMARRSQPKNLDAHALFIKWQEHARLNSDIPGGLLDRLGNRVSEFIRMNPTYADRMQPMIQRFDASRDWPSTEVVSLFDDIAAVHDLPFMLGWRGIFRTWEGDDYGVIIGKPLPPDLADSPWGPKQPNGVRLACRLEPIAKEVRIGTVLKPRVLIHNAGNETIVFCASPWVFLGMEVRDAKFNPIGFEGGGRMSSESIVPFRLAPGDFVELYGAPILIGKEEEYDCRTPIEMSQGSPM